MREVFLLLYYIGTYPTLTRTQKARTMLRERGFDVRLIRQSRILSTVGCSYAIALSDRDWSAAHEILRDGHMEPVKLFLEDSRGTIQQVSP